MNRLTLLRSRTTIKSAKFTMTRESKNPWDPILGFPYKPREDHVEPKDEELISK